MREAIPPLPQHSFMAWCSFKEHLYFTLPQLELPIIQPIAQRYTSALSRICEKLQIGVAVGTFINILVLLVTHENTKVKSFLCITKHHAMRKYWGSGGIASSRP
jgi:hypothetical protein